jgi:SIR2-like domain
MADDPPNELKAALAEGRALIVCGAGVSMAATGGAAPGWKGLIEAGLERAEAGLETLHAASGESWAEACRTYLLDKNADEWLYAADRVQEKLGGYNGAEYRGFFSEALSTLVNAKPALLTAIRKLADLGNPIATTNYDHLISATFGRDRVDWLNHAGVIEASRGKRKSVWHIHGDYDHPPSIIFSRTDNHRIGEHEPRAAAVPF